MESWIPYKEGIKASFDTNSGDSKDKELWHAAPQRARHDPVTEQQSQQHHMKRVNTERTHIPLHTNVSQVISRARQAAQRSEGI